jgi:hypothetical protein
MRMRRIISSSVTWLAVPRYVINGSIFGKKVTENKMCVSIFSPMFV